MLARILRSLRRRLIDAPRGFGHPVPAAAFDAEYRDGQWTLLDSTEEQQRYGALARLIRERCVGQPRLLDAGCGGARLAAEFSANELGAYHGVDLSREAIRRARDLAPAGALLVEGDLETWTPQTRYDAIVVNEVVGYFHDPALTLQRLSAALAPDGVLLVSLYRWGNFAAVWRRILREFVVVHHAMVVIPAGDKQWDIRVLRRPPSSA